MSEEINLNFLRTLDQSERGSSLSGLLSLHPSTIVVINLSGREFTTKLKNLQKLPASRLGKISLASSSEEILSLCDGYLPGQTPVFFFFRNHQHFQTILDIYRNSQLHLPEQMCPIVAQEEFRFWGLEEMLLEPCCILKYLPRTKEAHQQILEEIEENRRADRKNEAEKFEGGWCRILRSKLWDIMEYPETSKCAQLFTFISLTFVLVSTLTFVLQSIIEDQIVTTEDEEEERQVWQEALDQIDRTVLVFFTLEYLARLVLCPAKISFLLDKTNLVDLFGIVPCYLSFILTGLEDMQIIGKASKIVRLMRIMRVLRILRMVRHFVGLQSLFYTIHKAYREIGLILVIFLVTVIMFSTMVFAFESDWTFYDCIWWGLLTLTTVGYHHQPTTMLGQLVGGLCALCGVFILTLPIPLVVTSFAVCYKTKLWRNELATRKRLLRERRNEKSDILFHLATSSGMSGVRQEHEILPLLYNRDIKCSVCKREVKQEDEDSGF